MSAIDDADEAPRVPEETPATIVVEEEEGGAAAPEFDSVIQGMLQRMQLEEEATVEDDMAKWFEAMAEELVLHVAESLVHDLPHVRLVEEGEEADQLGLAFDQAAAAANAEPSVPVPPAPFCFSLWLSLDRLMSEARSMDLLKERLAVNADVLQFRREAAANPGKPLRLLIRWRHWRERMPKEKGEVVDTPPAAMPAKGEEEAVMETTEREKEGKGEEEKTTLFIVYSFTCILAEEDGMHV